MVEEARSERPAAPISRRTAVKGVVAAAGAAALIRGGVGVAKAAPAFVQNRKVTIEYWQTYAEYDSIAKTIAAFNEANRDIEVVGKIFGEYREAIQAIQAATAAGKPPGVAWLGFAFLRYGAANLPHFPIRDAAARDPEGDEFLTEFAPQVLALGEVDGVQHGMPFIIGTPYLFYNADLLAEAGFDRGPRTWDEVREYANAVKEATGRLGLYVSEFRDFWTQQALIESNGGQLLVSDGPDAPKTGLDGPDAIEAMQLYADMVLKDESALHADFAQGEQSFNSGLVAMQLASGGSLGSALESADFEVGTVPFPTFGDKPRKVPAGGANFFIFAEDKAEQAAAWKFIKFSTSPESLTSWSEETGFMPPRLELVDDPDALQPFFDAQPLYQAEIEQLPDAVPWASWPGPNGLEADQALLDFRDRILSGDQPVPEAAATAADRINGLING